jgi:hypothetical protein
MAIGMIFWFFCIKTNLKKCKTISMAILARPEARKPELFSKIHHCGRRPLFTRRASVVQQNTDII